MNSRLFPATLLALLLLPALADGDSSEQSLKLTVSPAAVPVSPGEPGRRFFPLPDLDYLFLLEPRCANGWTVSGLSLSIADSRVKLDPEVLSQPAIEAHLTVPAAQLAPLPLSRFCERPENPDDVPDYAANSNVVSAALSVQAALLCVSEQQRRMTYTAAPLDIELECSRAPALPPEDVAESR